MELQLMDLCFVERDILVLKYLSMQKDPLSFKIFILIKKFNICKNLFKIMTCLVCYYLLFLSISSINYLIRISCIQ